MRKKTKKVEMQEVANTTTQIFCDLCGIEADSYTWNSSAYEIDETEIKVTIRQKDGCNYPEGGTGSEFIIDLCPKCFKEKLIPWLNSQGAQIEEQSWSWG